jgi:hypothetical protein
MAVVRHLFLPRDSERLSLAALKTFFASIPLEFIGEPTTPGQKDRHSQARNRRELKLIQPATFTHYCGLA